MSDEDAHEIPDVRVTASIVIGGASAPHALVDRTWLEVIAGPDTRKIIDASAGRVVVGTHPSADVVLTDATVSRFHCEIAIEEGGRVVVRDLGSRNGTRVDGVTVFTAPLRRGSVVGVGQSLFRFEVGADRVKVPLSKAERFGTMVGRSLAMRRAFSMLERAAQSDVTVLLEGETGCGKEAAAESIHAEGARGAGPFIVVDCGAVPAELLESELFGHEKGAFTGASGAREGAFVAAAGGTIFLDEIGELALDLQPKLLRALEKKEVKRVGGDRYAPVDVRVIAATNRKLRAEVNAGRFRSDLFYRLAVLPIRLPPLRERDGDLPLLVDRLLEAGGAANRPEAVLLRAPSFLEGLARHAWPGNVRELRNHIERCLALREPAPPDADGESEGDAGDAELPSIDPSEPLRIARDRWVAAFEARYLRAVLAASGDNVSAAARVAGVDRIHLHRMLRKLGLRRG